MKNPEYLLNTYHWTGDSFGWNLPLNWEEIVDAANRLIDKRAEDLDLDDFEDADTLHEYSQQLYSDWCDGDNTLPDPDFGEETMLYVVESKQLHQWDTVGCTYDKGEADEMMKADWDRLTDREKASRTCSVSAYKVPIMKGEHPEAAYRRLVLYEYLPQDPEDYWEITDWKLDGSDNDKIRQFLADEKNIYNCEECPYRMEYHGHDTLPCGQYHCWVELHTTEGSPE